MKTFRILFDFRIKEDILSKKCGNEEPCDVMYPYEEAMIVAESLRDALDKYDKLINLGEKRLEKTRNNKTFYCAGIKQITTCDEVTVL